MKLFKIFKNQKGNVLSQSKGFTLIELLVVIGILSVLLAITLIAINPARQFAQANNTQRSSDVNTILNAVNQFMADNKGVLPTALSVATCTLAAPCTLSEDNDALTTTDVNLCSEIVSDYLAALPGDPQTGTNVPVTEAICTAATAYNTGYTIYQSSNSRITVSATAEAVGAVTPVISVTR